MPGHRVKVAQVRLDFAPIEQHLDGTEAEKADRLDISRKRLRYARTIGVPIMVADAWCIALGPHPDAVYGQAWWDACAEQTAREDEWYQRKLAKNRAADARRRAA